MKTKDMIKKVKSEVGTVLSAVANKAEFVAKISKLKLDIAKKNARINRNFKDIGEYVYSKRTEFKDDSYIADVFNEVDEIKKSIEELKTQIEDIKILQKEKHHKIEKKTQG